MTIIIESAIKLDTDQQTEIEKILSKKVENVQFGYKVNPDILGGLRITMGGKRIDLSLAGKVKHIQSELK